MSRQTDWLFSEIESWESEGLIDPSTGQLLRARYSPESSKSWGFSLVTAIGAIIFGLGVILFFAYNWQSLPKLIKLAMIFIALAAFHLLGWYVRYKSGRSRTADIQNFAGIQSPGQHNLSEGFHLIGTMMFGAGIFLIAQIYHIDEHYPNAFLVWGLGALLFAWVLPSVIQGIVATVLFAAWGGAEVLEFGRQHVLGMVLVLFGVLPLAWMQRSRVLLAVGLVAFIGLGLANLGVHLGGELVVYVLFAIGVMLIALSYAVGSTGFPQSAEVTRFVGAVIYGATLFAMTFVRSVVQKIPRIDSQPELLVLWCSLGVAAVVWVVMCVYGVRAKFQLTKSLQHGLILLSVLVMLVQAAIALPVPYQVFSLLYDAILASHCVLLILRGTDNLKWRQVAIGCVVLGVLVYARFNDLFESLLMRSLVFVLLGAMLFFIGHLYSKRKHRETSHA